MKKKSSILIILSLFAFLVVGVIGVISFYIINLSPVNKKSKKEVNFIVNAGEATNIIIQNLKKDNLIKNDLVLKIYAKLNPGVPMAGTYKFNQAMSASEIYSALLEGNVVHDTVWVTFVEGKRLTYIADVISKNFDYSIEEIESVLENEEYLKTLIKRYDCLSDAILNEKIYHPLEGYLFADTYEFAKDISIKGIIEKMLDNTEAKLSLYSENIESSKYSLHELMTLASIVELEGARSDDRKGVAGVFYNRLKSGWTLGSDVTTYYAVGKDFNVDLTWTDLKSCNAYNTRGTCVKGLPAGPIATPSFESLKAAIEPSEHDYYYFVADKYGKTYFNKTDSGHITTINKLKREGKWYEY